MVEGDSGVSLKFASGPSLAEPPASGLLHLAITVSCAGGDRSRLIELLANDGADTVPGS